MCRAAALLALSTVWPALAAAQPIEVPALPPTAAASAGASAAVSTNLGATWGATHRTPPPGLSNSPMNAPLAGPSDGSGPAGGDVPASLPPPLRTLSPDRPLTRRQSVVVSQAQHWRQRAARASVDADGWVHFPFGDGEPFVVCAVLHICDIRLQPGERVVGPPDISDPRWIVHPRYGVDGGTPVTHVIVKPSDTGLDGNIVLHTDRRTYSIGLVSREREYMPLVMFDYPDDAGGGEWPAAATSAAAGGSPGASPDDPCDGTPIVPPSAFRITGPRRAWTPAQVYIVATPVGEKTCIEFPSDIGSVALPALVAEADDATWFSDATPQVVNFRYLRRRFEVDEAMEHFALVSGVGENQEKDEIRRQTP